MAWVTQQFLDTWRSRYHVGSAKPRAVVQVCNIRYVRGYREWHGPKVNAIIPGETAELPWYPKIIHYTDWMTVPGVQSVEISQDFDQNGLAVATVVIDNVIYTPKTGALSQLYHLVEPGYLAPGRGFQAPTRPANPYSGNEFDGILRQMIAVRIWEGFGNPVLDGFGSPPADGGENGAWVFKGLADKPEYDSVPATITLTATQGKTLTEQRIFLWNKSRTLRDPITFADRGKTDETFPEGYRARASSTSDGGDYKPAYVLDTDTDSFPTEWASNFHDGPDVTEWIQISLDEGRYNSFTLDAPADMEMYVGVLPKAQKDGDPPHINEVGDVPVDEWIVGTGGGVVPGDNGGWHYMRSTITTLEGSHSYSLGQEIVVGKGTRLRLGFRSLPIVDESSGPTQYAAMARKLEGERRHRLTEAKKEKWVLVDDVSDIVRVALRWAGFGEWEVEDTGVKLPDKIIFNRGQYLIDIIKWAQELTGFVFFIADPDDNSSYGVPTFRRNATLLREPGAVVAEVTERDLLTGLRGSLDEEPLAFIIRVRGKQAAKRKGGRTLSGDRMRRLMYVLVPPWAGAPLSEDAAPLHAIGGVLKHFTHTYDHARSIDELKMAAYLIAVAEALDYAKAVVELPGNPNIELDDQVGLVDTNTGTNSRLWVANRTHTLTMGREGSWKMTLTGTLIDNQYVVLLLEQLAAENFGSLPNPIANTSNSRPRRLRA
jgi:hypothetical protein